LVYQSQLALIPCASGMALVCERHEHYLRHLDDDKAACCCLLWALLLAAAS